MLDVCKDKTLLEVYIEIVKRDDGAGGRDRELNDGKLIYDVLWVGDNMKFALGTVQFGMDYGIQGE